MSGNKQDEASPEGSWPSSADVAVAARGLYERVNTKGYFGDHLGRIEKVATSPSKKKKIPVDNTRNSESGNVENN